MKTRIACLLMMVLLFNPGPPDSAAAPERRVALVIGNGSYAEGPLRNPVNDATDMAASLSRLGFEVILKKNVRHQEMEESIEDFGNRLKRGGVGLFYYAGHGLQVAGANYLVPVGARIRKESDVRFQAVDAGKVLAEMENANNGLNIVILDACRDNPFARSFRSAARGLAIVTNAPTGTFISYSTGAGQVARDGEGRNSPYTRALLQYMNEPGVPITDVFMKVRGRLLKETGQVPWELSSLVGKFYFRPGSTAESLPADAGREQRRRPEEEKARVPGDKQVIVKTTPVPLPPAPGERDIRMFVERFLAASSRASVPALMEYYADRVDFFDKGVVGRDYVRRDKAAYYKRWPVVRLSLRGPVALSDTPEPDVKVAVFESEFSVSNPARRDAVYGSARNTLKIRNLNGKLVIVGEAQEITRREKK